MDPGEAEREGGDKKNINVREKGRKREWRRLWVSHLVEFSEEEDEDEEECFGKMSQEQLEEWSYSFFPPELSG
jgi:hypothetical protein